MSDNFLEEKLEALAKKKAKVQALIFHENKKNRKQRARRLVKQGLLIDFANLEKYPLSIILGYLMEFEEKHKGNTYYLQQLELKGKTKFLEKNYKEHEKGEK